MANCLGLDLQGTAAMSQPFPSAAGFSFTTTSWWRGIDRVFLIMLA